MSPAIDGHRVVSPVPACKTSYVLPMTIGGVMLVIVVLALGEYGKLHETLFDTVETPIRHHEFVIEAAAVLIAGTIVTLILQRLLFRVRRLSSVLTMCAWCRQVQFDDKWMSIEQCLQRRDRTKTTLGLCPACYRASVATPLDPTNR